MEAWEREHGIERATPGEMLVTYQGKTVRLLLPDPETVSRLGEHKVEVVKREIQHLELERLQAQNPAASVRQVQVLDRRRPAQGSPRPPPWGSSGLSTGASSRRPRGGWVEDGSRDPGVVLSGGVGTTARAWCGWPTAPTAAAALTLAC